MKAQDLRLGSSVKYKKGHVGNIVSIKGNDIEVDNEYLKGGIFDIKHFNPIPLTEDILLKCEGIEQYSTHANGTVYYQFKHEEPSKHLVVRVNKFDPVTFSIFNHSECDFTQLQFIKRVDFLHELQNGYYFLTGEELNVKL